MAEGVSLATPELTKLAVPEHHARAVVGAYGRRRLLVEAFFDCWNEHVVEAVDTLARLRRMGRVVVELDALIEEVKSIRESAQVLIGLATSAQLGRAREESALPRENRWLATLWRRRRWVCGYADEGQGFRT